MNPVHPVLKTLYSRLPGSLRSLAASYYGYKLARVRFGPETDRLADEALEREHWSARQWQEWQQERLVFVLGRAATQIPYYKSQWEKRRRSGDRASWEYLENWPVLEKAPLRDNPRAFVATDCDVSKMLADHTSGTTGTPLTIWSRPETVRAWFALIEARWHRWYGVDRHDRHATICGQVIAPAGRTKPPCWVWNAPMKQLYMSTFHISPELAPCYLRALWNYGIEYVFGYASSIYALAHEALERGHRMKLRVVMTNAEPLEPHQRAIISEAFDCAVFQTYGMSETVTAASECEFGGLHLWPEVGYTEIVSGDLIATSLLNADMPLIRYRIGDRATAANDAPCGCGKTLPRLASLDGRAADVLVTKDGREVVGLTRVFYELPIRLGQIIQESADLVRVLYVPANGCEHKTVSRTLIKRMQDRLGAIAIVPELVDDIPRQAGGKFRMIIRREAH